MIYMAKNIQIDDKRYRYFITDKDRAKRIFKKGSEAILKQLAKDTQHKLNKLNEKWYNTGSPSEHYTRIANTNAIGGSILKNNGYQITQSNDGNVLNLYYSTVVMQADNPPFGRSIYLQGKKDGRRWRPHGEKNRFDFSTYIDFIETGGSDWVDSSEILRNRASQIRMQATHATEKLQEWYNKEVQTAAFRNELYEVTRTSLIASFKT